ncbi:MAG TPA: hypothetical protein RMH99_30935, partial [Sandaracinaceae bacterium LLY-WYZ-13_1]|nr:hypothetical protein [Sandaracinaceae bacterium LLY-WYZ-13_1]
MPMGDPNLLAYAALVLWVPVVVLLFAKLRPPLAAIVSMLFGVLFLPEQTVIDAPLLPPMDKGTITGFWVFACCLVKSRHRIRSAKPMRGLDLLFVLVLLGNVGTVLTNGDTLVAGPVVRPGMTLYDGFSAIVRDTLGLYLPFLIGRSMMRTSRDLDDLMRWLVILGLGYSLLALFEIRMSPQLHRWFYGFHQMSFSMTYRLGGYRPTIFMITGMAVAMFFLASAIAATARWKAGRAGPWAALWLSGILLAVKSSGAIVYGVAILPVVAFVRRPRTWIPAALAILVLTYPILRGLELFPTDTLVELAEEWDEERALSLWFRFDQEDALLDRAMERPIFGWGTYGRNRVFDEHTGEDLSITDGDWVINLGSRGVVGFVGLFGMLGLSILLAAYRRRHIVREEDRIQLAGLAMISSLFLVDLLPNGLFNYLPYFFTGAVAGLSRTMVETSVIHRAILRERAARARAEARAA